MSRLTLLLAVAILGLTGANIVEVRPRPFPRRVSYTAQLETNGLSRLCQNCTFEGRHYFDADPCKSYGLVQWVYGKTQNFNEPVGKRNESLLTNFMDIFLGSDQKMFLIADKMSDDASAAMKKSTHETPAGCMMIHHPQPVFNETWSAGAKYEGQAFWRGRLVRKFSNVYPFFIQGEIYPGVYYEEALSPYRPVGYSNRVCELFYENDFVAFDSSDHSVVHDDMFTSVKRLNCQSAGPHDAKVEDVMAQQTLVV